MELLQKELKLVEFEIKRKQLLAANKAAARILLLGIMTESSGMNKTIKHNYNGVEK